MALVRDNRHVSTGSAHRLEGGAGTGVVQRSRPAVFNGTGLVPETAATSAVILSNCDGYDGLMRFHYRMLSTLPKDVKAIIVCPIAEIPELKEEFAADFKSGRFSFLKALTDSNWARDFCPDAVRSADGTMKLVDFNYEGRGAADEVPKAISKTLKLPRAESQITLEGGNLMVDGRGRLYVSTKVLEKNKPKTREAIGAELKKQLGVKTIVWMPKLPKENTGHVDIYCKIVDDNTMLVSDSKDPAQKRMLDKVAERLKKLGFSKVVRLMDSGVSGNLSRSYTNSLFVNGTAYVPSYFDSTIPRSDPDHASNLQTKQRDAEAQQAYKMLGFKVVPVDMSAMANYGGAIHCLTHQIPAM